MFTINVVNDFSKKPYGRYPNEGDCGQDFRQKLLVPALNAHQKVHVVLDGYNRYGRSFLDEAFGGLIREEGFKWADLKSRLTYTHSKVKSIESLIEERLDAARTACE
ncbi:STAS-like domain-containing protein [Pseudomonas carnis]|uniref:STAS-like domain-containing protein n=1 Tax=Pseudomonas TaxID=286 RepID=UPI0015A135B0|nr:MULTISPECIES: STAS-like domain-containing protein [Pseudomonas]MBJ2225721.1 STAS-like domain-containing protein [Pseudomonas sp. MF7451]MBW9236778.1 STAS-like domain-containing protein [Pseudomonas carnis]NVZ88118.1 STAS-like domain-containing protein [Pseudomonas yamanorum]